MKCLRACKIFCAFHWLNVFSRFFIGYTLVSRVFHRSHDFSELASVACFAALCTVTCFAQCSDWYMASLAFVVIGQISLLSSWKSAFSVCKILKGNLHSWNKLPLLKVMKMLCKLKIK